MMNMPKLPLDKAYLPVLMLALSGCTLMPDYLQPSAPVAPNWPFAVSAENKGPSIAELGWQDFFKSPELRALIAKGLANNRDLRIAALNIDVARAQYRVQRSDLLPDINAGGSLSRSRTPQTTSSTGSAQTNSTYTANVSTTAFELDLFGRLRSLNEAAMQEYLATDEARNSVQISLIAEISNSYLQLLADRAQQQLAQQTLQAQQDSYDISQRRFNEGIGSQLDLSQARTLLETARVDSITYARIVQQDRNALDLLVGAQVQDAELVGVFEQADQFVSTLQAGLPSDLLLNRPDIRQAEHSLKAANANIGAARAAFFPTISLTASGGTAGTELSQLFGAGSGLWTFVPQITLPLFSGGRNVANFDIAELRKNIAVASYEKAIQSAFRDVANALVARETLDDELAAQQQLVNANDESYHLSQARYEQGVSGYLDVLDARRNMYGAQQQLISRRLAMLQNYIALYAALGGGQLDKAPPSAAPSAAPSVAPSAAF